MIEVRQLAKSFAVATRARRARGQRDRGSEAALQERDGERRVHAVRDVSFDAPNGSITGLLGPNGAGKTTTLRMLAALIAPDAGSNARG
jgi:sodium transport system ATP-binding protein